jgi:anti-sigma regulatory factor (Ser/Thr protein kinase)
VDSRSGPSIGARGDDEAEPSSDPQVRAAPHFELLLEADPGVLAPLRHLSTGWLHRLRWPEVPMTDAVTALDAAVSNGVQHAYRGPGGHVSVHALVAQDRGNSAARFTVRDWGRWRNRNPPWAGHGMVLMEELSSDLYIETGPEGTTVILTTPLVTLR